ncbi:biliverdin-producing heme oxygenase [Actinomycetota bacterium]|nr:biliverdin-producing heme oxygenase [Actinomycetota bacterium]
MTSAVAAQPSQSPSPGTAPAPPPLSTLFREGTRDEHRAAESAGFVEALMAGRLPRAAYADLAAQLHVVYDAIEAVGDELSRTAVGATVVFPELVRVPALEADLKFLVGPDWAERVRILPATRRYADRVRETGAEPALWAAHAYTRYLGDLAGGQAIARAMAQHYGLDRDGLRFYAFEQIPRPKAFRDLYRSRLDALPLDDAGRDAAVREARAAFAHNRAVFADLGTVHGV